MGPPPQFGAPLRGMPLTRIVAPMGSSTEGPGRRVRMRHPALFRHAPREDPGPLLPLFSSAPPKAPEARFAPLAVPRGRADRRADQPQRVARRCNPSRLTSVTPSVPRGRADRRAGLPQRVTSRCNPLRLTSATPSTTPFCPVRARLSHFRDPLPLVSTCFAALAVARGRVHRRANYYAFGNLGPPGAPRGPAGPPQKQRRMANGPPGGFRTSRGRRYENIPRRK